MAKEILVVAGSDGVPAVLQDALRVAFKGHRITCARRNPGEVQHPYTAVIAVHGARIHAPRSVVLNLQETGGGQWQHSKIELHRDGHRVCSFKLDLHGPGKVKWDSKPLRQALAA